MLGRFKMKMLGIDILVCFVRIVAQAHLRAAIVFSEQAGTLDDRPTSAGPAHSTP